MTGNWVLDHESVKIVGNNWKLLDNKMEITRNGETLSMIQKVSWKNGQGNVVKASETLAIIPRILDGKVQVGRTWAWNNGGGQISAGLFDMSDGKFSGTLTAVDAKTPWAKLAIDHSDADRIGFHYQALNPQGEQQWSLEFDVVKY